MTDSIEVLRMVKADCVTDTQEIEGRAVTGPLLAEQFGIIRAQIATLADVMIDHLEETREPT